MSSRQSRTALPKHPDSLIGDQEPVSIDITLEMGGLRQQVTVTSGSRIEELQQDSPIKVEAVTRDAMINTGYERLSDVLNEIPGVVTRSGSSGSVSTEQIWGISARQVAVLQDGLPIVGARGSRAATSTSTVNRQDGWIVSKWLRERRRLCSEAMRSEG